MLWRRELYVGVILSINRIFMCFDTFTRSNRGHSSELIFQKFGRYEQEERAESGRLIALHWSHLADEKMGDKIYVSCLRTRNWSFFKRYFYQGQTNFIFIFSQFFTTQMVIILYSISYLIISLGRFYCSLGMVINDDWSVDWK
jgi:hypothetical protein